ncbi:hypothetical protein D1632_14940 [Chryseobacterium nematophagum]|uniref:Type VI secretion system transmembrane protein TssO n=1 Tax=Chryseobacterium nematophagum TaxID=2305228 RepID=A0A3M7L8C4_9FLAO|nr:type VI secretion system TssO [Chryseobacterium nematophagum]RMZ58867.1 hypothetical protein D1632_14940 [Chryseobacterium nematophagum]
MEGHITLSKKEKQYQFLYLVLMLFAALLFLSVIFLKGFESPFSDEDIISVQNLEEKVKFDHQQKIGQRLLDSTFLQVDRLKTDEIVQPFVENNIMYGINDIANYFQNKPGSADVRKEAYPQLAEFYKMYFEDKKILSTRTEDIKRFEKQIEECRIGFKDKQNQLFQRENALKARTQ